MPVPGWNGRNVERERRMDMKPIDPAAAAPLISPALSPERFWMFRGPSAYVPVTPWTPWRGTLAGLAVFALAVLVVGVLLAATMIAEAPLDEVTLNVAGTLLQQAVMIALTWYVATWYAARPADVLALRKPAQGWKAYPIAFVALLVAALVMSNVVRLIDPELTKTDVAIFQEMLRSRWWWLTFVLVGIGAPLSEELLARGLLFSALAKSRLGVVGASLITSAGWSLVHIYSPAGMAQVFVIGLIFSWVLVRTGSLRVCIVCHGLYNTLMAALLMANVIP
jgi:uncharacterized protein